MPLPSNLHTSSSPEGETLALTGKQVDQLHQAICSAFPSSSSLEMMVRTKLEKNLSDIAGGTNLTEIVFNLIKWAEAQGKLQELVQKAYETIPDNPKLRRFSAQLSRLSTIPVPPVGNTVNASTVLI